MHISIMRLRNVTKPWVPVPIRSRICISSIGPFYCLHLDPPTMAPTACNTHTQTWDVGTVEYDIQISCLMDTIGRAERCPNGEAISHLEGALIPLHIRLTTEGNWPEMAEPLLSWPTPPSPSDPCASMAGSPHGSTWSNQGKPNPLHIFRTTSTIGTGQIGRILPTRTS